MINVVLMIGSMIAAAAILMGGLVFTFSPPGSTWMGLFFLVLMGAWLVTACIPPSLAEYRRWRHRRFLHEQATPSLLRPSARPADASAYAQEPKLRLVRAAEETPAKADSHQPPTAA